MQLFTVTLSFSRRDQNGAFIYHVADGNCKG